MGRPTDWSEVLGMSAQQFIEANAGTSPEALDAHKLSLALARLYSKGVARYPARTYLERIRGFVADVNDTMGRMGGKAVALPPRTADVPGRLARLEEAAAALLKQAPGAEQTIVSARQDHQVGLNPGGAGKAVDLIASLLQRHHEGIDYAFYHGSYATRDAIAGGSDLDLVIFLSEGLLASDEAFWTTSRTLGKIDLLIKKVDILSHHGPFVRPTSTRSYFVEGLAPRVLFDIGRRVTGAPISLRMVNRPFYRFLGLSRQILIHEYYRASIVKGGAVTWKNVIADALLMPCVTLQCIGDYVYKRDAFPLFYERYGHLDTTVLAAAERHRTKWGSQLNLYRHLPTVRNPWVEKAMAAASVRIAERRFQLPPVEERVRLNEGILSLYQNIMRDERWWR